MKSGQIDFVWSEAYWNEYEHLVRQKALSAKSDRQAWKGIVKASRKVMFSYTTSFFIVSRFLPPFKRHMVEIIYATVRYPDEVVDTFPLTAEERDDRIDRWRSHMSWG